MISFCAVDVSTPQARGWNIASSSSHEVFGISASSPSSTAANATSPPASGCPPRSTCTVAFAVWRTPYCGCAGVTLTSSRCSSSPTRSAATPSLNAGLARSTIAVGGW